MDKKRIQQLAGILNENHDFLGVITTPGLGQIQNHGNLAPSSFGGSNVQSYLPGLSSGDDIEMIHEDDEAGMMAEQLATLIRHAEELHGMLCELDKSGMEVDFPHWWQSKIILATEYIVKATNILKEETSKEQSSAPASMHTFM